MEINEAIKHCREKAVGCSACAKDHGQLAEWLEELQNYRDTGLTPSMVRSLIKREKESHKRAVERAIQLDELQERIRWIPVEERLPADIVNPVTRDAYVYPVTVDLGGVTDTRYYSFCHGHWYNCGQRIMDYMVLAWVPLPEPYKAE